ncbi:MAG: hypothetical protein RHS_5299 [Robinsoniella sp. RHS]|nr:MAG: hypothetical protein RHS_5299 [Robinsoniella sp. RHS]
MSVPPWSTKIIVAAYYMMFFISSVLSSYHKCTGCFRGNQRYIWIFFMKLIITHGIIVNSNSIQGMDRSLIFQVSAIERSQNRTSMIHPVNGIANSFCHTHASLCTLQRLFIEYRIHYYARMVSGISNNSPHLFQHFRAGSKCPVFFHHHHPQLITDQKYFGIWIMGTAVSIGS